MQQQDDFGQKVPVLGGRLAVVLKSSCNTTNPRRWKYPQPTLENGIFGIKYYTR
jgi:hypothetical protein